MSIKGFFTLLFKHITSKWGRVLLSSLGIMIGVWSILLTVTLSTGLEDKLQVAVNSQAIVKSVQYYRENTGVSSLLDFRPDSKFESISYEEHQRTAQGNEDIKSFAPSDIASLYINTDPATTKCVDQSLENIASTPNPTAPLTELENCHQFQILNLPFDLVFETIKSDWYGSTEAPQANELISCFECSDTEPLYEILGVTTPEEMVGKKISVEINSAAVTTQPGQEFELIQTAPVQTQIPQTVIQEYTISSVIDDREISNPLATPFASFFFVPREFFVDALEIKDPTADPKQIGYIELNAFIDDFNNLESVIEYFQDQNYLVVSTGELLASSIRTAFTVITIILGVFAAIALFASVFGIVNVMIISVLERRKEIGILKALGATSGDIFNIFLVESIFLGILGWILGYLLTLGLTSVLSGAFDALLLNNDSIRSNLETLNITSFDLPIPPYILIITFLLAIIFTMLSGLYPALQAARQNPTDVLRSE